MLVQLWKSLERKRKNVLDENHMYKWLGLEWKAYLFLHSMYNLSIHVLSPSHPFVSFFFSRRPPEYGRHFRSDKPGVSRTGHLLGLLLIFKTLMRSLHARNSFNQLVSILVNFLEKKNWTTVFSCYLWNSAMIKHLENRKQCL